MSKLNREKKVENFLKSYMPWISKSDLEFLTTYLKYLPSKYFHPEKITKVLKVSHENKTWETP